MKNKVKQFGEVFTPEFLVNDMLDTLPTEVWSNPNLKWFDPCGGANMVFPIEIYKRLMVSLSNYEKDVSKLDNHIWDNMIFICELQEESVAKGIIEIEKIRYEYTHR